MPWIPMYLVQEDIPNLIELLGEDIAFILGDGDRRWRATLDRSRELGPRTALWHVPSGSLPLLRSLWHLPAGKVGDPWTGWTEERTGANETTPYFGAGHPGVFWLNLRIPGRGPGSVCGMSSFEWIGNHYSVAGNPALPVTVRRWEKLRRQVKKCARKVPRGGTREPSPAEI